MLRFPLLSLCCALVCCSLAAAADDKDQPVYTDPAMAGEDFALQGEYTNEFYSQPLGIRTMGLQVVALGDGKFTVVEFSGGLPGNGWDRAGREEYPDLPKDGSTLQYKTEDTIVTIGGDFAVVRDPVGRHLATLKKVKRQSSTLGQEPPPGAQVLINGQSTDAFRGKVEITPEGYLLAGGITQDEFRDFKLHLEFRTPFKPFARGQGRGNSGVYIQERYEVQVLDSFGLEGKFNECGALYRQREPDLNMCFPPLTWQTYDIEFRSPRFDDAGNKIENARITVWHNGVAVHDNVDVVSKTGAGKKEAPTPGPIKLQDHGNPVVYRNFWILER